MPKLPKPSSSEPVPAGTYKVRIVSYEHGHSRKKGTPQITWKAEVIEPQEFEGKIIFERTMMVDTSLWKLANLLGNCGLDFPADVDTDSSFFSAICQASLGRVTYWNIAQKTLDTGTTVNEVKDYRSDEDQELLQVKPESDSPNWLEGEK